MNGRKTPMEEAQPTSPARNLENEEEQPEEDIDVKKMKVNFLETKQIMEIVKEFEADYSSSKDNINLYDTHALEDGITIKTIKQCYKTLNDNLMKSNPNFDKIKMNT
jgi:hypothetical protein